MWGHLVDKNHRTANFKSKPGEKDLENNVPKKSKWEISGFKSYCKVTIGC